MELQGRLPDLRSAGISLVAISYDPVPVLADFAARRSITFPLLSDAGSETIKRYGILNTTVDPQNQLYGYPFPGTFVVNRKGMVTSRFFEEAYQERTTVSSMLVRLGRRVNLPVTRVEAAHVTVTSYASDQVAAPGTHFSLVVDVVPATGVHVYAPGASGYRAVTLTIQPQPGVVMKAAQFPKSEDYFFKPLKEHIPVYQRPFR
ncbi:MAG: redoxin domain-containing protein, partial [Vicinamibacterales bacterium]